MEELRIVLAYNNPEEIKVLFSEYTKMLVENDNSFAEYLKIQNYDEEVNNLEKKYGYNEGRLYLAYYDDKPAGCIGLKKINENKCEMKRLFVRPEFRNKGIGEKLTEIIIKDAIELGYKEMYLDTLPFLKTALKMYINMGFYEIAPYNDSPVESSIFMRKDLYND